MRKKQLDEKKNAVSIDKKSGSLAYNRFEMQISQALHMAIELYPNLNYLLVLDHYDDITLFDDDVLPETVSYYQMKTSEDSISIDTAISEDWIATVYKGNIIKNLIMDCQSYTKYRPNETTGGIFVSWRRKEELPTGA